MSRILRIACFVGLVLHVTPASADSGGGASTFICDLRHVFGTCKEYDPKRLSSDAEDFYRSRCTDHEYGGKSGKYFEGRRCPVEDRVGACLGTKVGYMPDDWRYNEYYYTGTSKDFNWEPEGFSEACKESGGELEIY